MKKAFQRLTWPEHEQILRHISRRNAHEAKVSLTLSQKGETPPRPCRRLKSRHMRFRYSRLTPGLRPRLQVSRPIVLVARLPLNWNAARYFPWKRPPVFA